MYNLSDSPAAIVPTFVIEKAPIAKTILDQKALITSLLAAGTVAPALQFLQTKKQK